MPPKRAVATKKAEATKAETRDDENDVPSTAGDNAKGDADTASDELASINGVKPKKYLKDDESTEVMGSGCARLQRA